jgi:uncharacterized integral membrane protein
MEMIQLSLLLVVGVLLAGGPLHLWNLERIHRKITVLKGYQVTKDDLYKEISIPQGSNFSSLAMTAWMLLFVAIAFLYFLTPSVFAGFNYFQVPSLASNPLGFLILGVIVSGGIALIVVGLNRLPERYGAIKFADLYSFYQISKRTKTLIALTVLWLWLSICSSTYLGTIYPEQSDFMVEAAFVLLFGSLLVLISPIIKEAMEGMR